MFGAVGVAIGTLVGALVGVAGNLFYNMRRTVSVAFKISDYLRDGLLRPAICALPLITYVVFELNRVSASAARYLWLAVALVATGFLIWRWGLLGSERDRLRSWCLVPEG
jgi:hypothetical protein